MSSPSYDPQQINIPRGDFVLRPDAVTLLTSSRVEASALLFEEEVDLSALKHASRLAHLVLVDHNRIASRQEQYLPHVVEIVDHHVDEKMYPETAKTHIALVGNTIIDETQ
jgi:exopolyphosphatase